MVVFHSIWTVVLFLLFVGENDLYEMTLMEARQRDRFGIVDKILEGK